MIPGVRDVNGNVHRSYVQRVTRAKISPSRNCVIDEARDHVVGRGTVNNGSRLCPVVDEAWSTYRTSCMNDAAVGCVSCLEKHPTQRLSVV